MQVCAFVCAGARVCGGQVDVTEGVPQPFSTFSELVSVAGVRYACDFPVGSLLSVLYWFLEIFFCPLSS